MTSIFTILFVSDVFVYVIEFYLVQIIRFRKQEFEPSKRKEEDDPMKEGGLCFLYMHRDWLGLLIVLEPTQGRDVMAPWSAC